METKQYLSHEDALKQFLLNIDCLDPVENSNSFNPFDVLKIARAEIRHSNMLAWLLDPNESHGLGARIVSALIAFVVQRGYVDNDTAFWLLTLQHDDVVVKREWKNIDILIESLENKYVICIENKVDTQDHSCQLDRYYKSIGETEKYEGFIKVFLYLTPDGLVPNEDKNNAWETMQYSDVIAIIEKELEKASLSQETYAFINYYVEVLRRETMEDNSIAELCRNIYATHKQALDLIFEYRPDMLQNVSEIFDKWCKKKDEDGTIIYDKERSNKSYHRFRTTVMDAFIPPAEVKSDWNTKNHYYYEIGAYMDGENVKYNIHFVVNSTNLKQEEKDFLKDFCKKINKKKNPKEDWKFITAHASQTTIITPDDIQSQSIEETIMKTLDKAWDAVKEKVESQIK